MVAKFVISNKRRGITPQNDHFARHGRGDAISREIEIIAALVAQADSTVRLFALAFIKRQQLDFGFTLRKKFLRRRI